MTAILLGRSGQNLTVKLVEGPQKSENRQIWNKVSVPKYNIFSKEGKFLYWETPLSSLKDVYATWKPEDIALDPKVTELVDQFNFNQIPLDQLKRETITKFPLDGKVYRDYQEKFISFDFRKKNICNFLKTGSGKLMISIMRLENMGCKRILVFTTKGNFDDWEAQCRSLLDVEVLRYTGTKQQREKLDLSSSQIVLTNYDQVKEIIERTGEDFFDGMICDEAHTLGKYSGKKYKSVLALQRKNKNRKATLVCTATPLESNLDTLWSVLNLCDPAIAGKMDDFLSEYQEITRWQERELKNGHIHRFPIEFKTKNLEGLRKLLSTIAFRFDTSDNFKFKQTTRVIPVEITDKQFAIYKQAVQEFEDFCSGDGLVNNPAAAMIQSQKLFKMAEGIFDDEPLSGKFEWLKEELKYPGEKTMICTSFVAPSEAYYDYFRGRAVIYNGDKSDGYKKIAKIAFNGAQDKEEEEYFYKKRDHYGLPFKNPGDAELFIIVLASNSAEGMNLQAAKRQIYTSVSIKARVTEQGMGRNKRLDTKHDISYDFLAANRTIDYRFIELVFQKMNLQSQVLDGINSKNEIRTRDILKLVREEKKWQQKRNLS